MSSSRVLHKTMNYSAETGTQHKQASVARILQHMPTKLRHPHPDVEHQPESDTSTGNKVSDLAIAKLMPNVLSCGMLAHDHVHFPTQATEIAYAHSTHKACIAKRLPWPGHHLHTNICWHVYEVLRTQDCPATSAGTRSKAASKLAASPVKHAAA